MMDECKKNKIKNCTMLFKRDMLMPKEILINMLEDICEKDINNYVIKPEYYKSGIYSNNIKEFMGELKKYYHKSKQKYLDNATSYNKFMTIVRQLCNYYEIEYIIDVKYVGKNEYQNIYKINRDVKS
jgi:hypothetical protein